ncbi:MAG TPA: alpha/beta hydrolase [Pirellulales bacterium]|jgi:hypothetical protein|nr:alpha/beta hydrolase [Pirellulales bacterium]
MRKDVEFKTEDGLTLRGWHYVPTSDSGPFPTVVMAHGFSCVKEMFLDKYADVFVAAGLGVLVYDNRNFGDSDGLPRQEVDPWGQIRDYRHAITYAGTLPDVDSDRIGIWGTSYTGGHVLVVAAIDKRVKCVVSQVPVVSGYRNAHRALREDLIPEVLASFAADRDARFAGKAPAMVPVASQDPGTVCAFPGKNAYDSFLGAPRWRNEVTLRSLEMFWEHETIGYVDKIGPTPLLMIIEDADTLAAVDQTLEAYDRALEPKKLLVLSGGHFDAYVRDQRLTAEAARDWYVQHLCGQPSGLTERELVAVANR